MASAKKHIQWSDNLLTGDTQIDNEHKAFFLKAQRVLVACELGRGDEEVLQTLRFMKQYARLHLAHEEERMQQVDYPYAETHKGEHRVFTERLAELEKQLENGADLQDLAERTAEEALRWFSRHIRLVDRPFIDFLREKKKTVG